MKKIVASVLLLAVLALGIVLGYAGTQPGTRPPEGEQDAAYARVIADITAITAVPHTAGSPENAAVRDYIARRAESFGFTAEIQPFQMDVKSLVAERVASYEGGSALYRQRMDNYVAEGNYSSLEAMHRGRLNAGDADFLTLENILVKIPGTAPTGAVMFVSHYDSVLTAPGAADDGLAVACMLQLMEQLNAAPSQNDVYLLFTDGEENGLLGAAHFVTAFPEYADVIDVLFNFEARGNRGALLMFESSENDYGLVRAFQNAVPQPVAFSPATAIYSQMPNGTDFTEFKNAGYYGLNFAMIEGDENYHQPTDSIDNLDRDTAYQYYETIRDLGAHFGNTDLAAIRDTQSAVYFPLPLVGVVSIPAPWAGILGFLPLAMALFLAVLALRDKQTKTSRKVARIAWLAVLGVLCAGSTVTFFPANYLFFLPCIFFLAADILLTLRKGGTPWVSLLLVLIAVLAACLVYAPLVYLIHLALKLWYVTAIFVVLPLVPSMVYGLRVISRMGTPKTAEPGKTGKAA